MRFFECVLLAQLALGTAALAEQNQTPTLPPITEPPSGQRLPGKFVWADLFSSDTETSRRFYEQVFGWTWRPIKQPPQPYGVFYLDGEPVAGLAFRRAPDEGESYGRWIHYISVEDVGAAEKAIGERRGRILLSRRSYPDRGDFAIVTDAHEIPFGIIRSSSGDPGDYQAAQGEWIWRELFTPDLGAAKRFYAEIFAYELGQDSENSEIVEYLLESNGYLRAGIGVLSEDADAAPAWLGYVRVDDVATALRRVIAHGGRVLLEPRPQVADGGLAIVADPTGATIGLLYWEYQDEDLKETRP